MSFARILKEPLLHFLLIGAALFVAHSLIAPTSSKGGKDTILVSAGRIEQLATDSPRPGNAPRPPMS
jgi:hypothetical protein